ncbi:MAG: prepilin peptidase [Planctomycetes bacterium]|nr:prepilin peptidase [Planctomycetota bacterium]
MGSFLNVVAARVPLEKSVLWPGSQCSSCYQPIRWYSNIPIWSYFCLRGRCSVCGARFSARYVIVELIGALGFAGLYYLVLVRNIHGWPVSYPASIAEGHYPLSWWVGYFHNAVLFSFLLAVALCDLDSLEIPLSITLVGTLVGLLFAVLCPWPWPNTSEVTRLSVPLGTNPDMAWIVGDIKQGIYAWPVWGPLPSWLAPGGNWQTGLATGLAGALVGTFFLRAIGFLVGTGLGKEALGLGDADLMMMAGAFLGWQLVVVGLFVSIVPALFFALFNALARKEGAFPFGPSLAAGVMLTSLCWTWIVPWGVQPLFFSGLLLLGVVVVSAPLMLGISYLLRLLQRG